MSANRTPRSIKRATHHDDAGFIPGMPGVRSARKCDPCYLPHQQNEEETLRSSQRMQITRVTKFDACVRKTRNTMDTEGNSLNVTRATRVTPTRVQTQSSVMETGSAPSQSMWKAGGPTASTSARHGTARPGRHSWTRERKRRCPNQRTVKSPVLADTPSYVENPRDATKKAAGSNQWIQQRQQDAKSTHKNQLPYCALTPNNLERKLQKQFHLHQCGKADMI